MEFAQLWWDCSCLNFQVALEIEMESSFLTLETVVDETIFLVKLKFPRQVGKLHLLRKMESY